MVLRAVVDGALPLDLCEALISLHKGLAMRGYREKTWATPLHALMAYAPHRCLPLLRARELARDAIESAISGAGSAMDAHAFEFTALMTWREGAQIGAHYDANRDYLEQRKVSCVIYLNSQGAEFEGGTFHFEDEGESSAGVAPLAGRLVCYSSDGANVHRVDKVCSGFRHTLVIWLTDDYEFSEDRKLIEMYACGSHGLHALPDGLFLSDDGADIRTHVILPSCGCSYCEVQVGDGESRKAAAHLLIKDDSGEEIECEGLNHAVAVALAHARMGGSLRDARATHNERESSLKDAVKSCWAKWVNMGELYVPDDLTGMACLLPAKGTT